MKLARMQRERAKKRKGDANGITGKGREQQQESTAHLALSENDSCEKSVGGGEYSPCERLSVKRRIGDGERVVWSW